MKRELIVQRNPKSPVAEVFRTLRTNIQFMNSNRRLRSLLVTSTMPGEGKSWVASNLAVTFAQAGKRVALIDAHTKLPSQISGGIIMANKRTYLVTGAAGYLGSEVCRQLLEQNTDVVMVDTGDSYEGICGYFFHLLHHNGWAVRSGKAVKIGVSSIRYGNTVSLFENTHIQTNPRGLASAV